MLDAYVSLYRAEHGETPWQRLAEPPPSPRAPVAAEETRTRRRRTTERRDDGAWAPPRRGVPGARVQRLRGGSFHGREERKSLREAFGAFGPAPATPRPRRFVFVSLFRVASGPHRVRFDPAVFRWLEDFEEDWLAEAAATTRELGARECAS